MPDKHTLDETSPLFDDFNPPTYEEWYETTVQSLKGASFEKKLIKKSYEGFELQPIYNQADIDDLAHMNTLPGSYPFVRGADVLAYPRQPWHIAQELLYGSPSEFNKALRHDMERGQTAINIPLDDPSRLGLDPQQAEETEVGAHGLSLASLADLATTLEGISLEDTPIFIQSDTAALIHAAFLAAYFRQQGHSTKKMSGCVASDPIGTLTYRGSVPSSVETAYDRLAALTQWAAQHAPDLATIAVHSASYHNSGANAVQEIAFTLGTAVEYLRALSQRGMDINTTAHHLHFFFAIGSNFFMEVAKLRAARLLWANIVRAFEGDSDAQKMTLHVRTADYNKTLYDPYVNMLRTTVEALAGAVGGVESMHVAAFDELLRTPNEFSRRVARNQQLILQKECNLTRLVDPAGGSYYVEYLTDQLGRHAWALFQQVEGQGGMLQSLQNGFPQQAIAQVVEQRAANLAHRRDRLVGTNIYPNLDEEKLATDKATSIYRERVEYFQSLHEKTDAGEALEKLANLSPDDGPAFIEATVEAALAGATLNQIVVAIHSERDETPAIAPLPLIRAAEPFEGLRRASKDYLSRTGHRPQIFLANMGSLAQHKARTDFTIGFYEVGGFELLNNESFATPEEAAEATLASGAPAMVICSTDDIYADIVPPLVTKVKEGKPDMIVVLAGYPKDQVEAYRAAGVDDFIHLRANCYEMNEKLLRFLGVV